MKIGIKNVVKNTLDGLFPPFCRGCGRREAFLCERCKKYISENMGARSFEERGSFRKAEYLGFRDEILGELVEEAKYESVRGLVGEIAEVVWRGYFSGSLCEGVLKKSGIKTSAPEVILVPMPTSRKHVRERGLDHMDKLAREIERFSEGRVRRVRLLERRRDTVQVGASPEVRRKQAKEAVEMSLKYLGKDGKVLEEYRGARVVLIDDVWTTGASMLEAGKILTRAGVEDLSAVAVTKNRTKRSPVIRRGVIELDA